METIDVKKLEKKLRMYIERAFAAGVFLNSGAPAGIDYEGNPRYDDFTTPCGVCLLGSVCLGVKRGEPHSNNSYFRTAMRKLGLNFKQTDSLESGYMNAGLGAQEPDLYALGQRLRADYYSEPSQEG